jgi:hypothetical protein
MKHSFVKMMNRIAEMENCILKGLVLDELGNWVTIADRKAVEEETMAHLSSGQVLFEGRWVNFPELKKSRSRRVEKPPFFNITSVFRTIRPVKEHTEAVPTPQQTPTPPDTSLFVMSPEPKKTAHSRQEPHPPAKKETPAPVPNVALETSIILETPASVPAAALETSFIKMPPEPMPDGAPETAIIVHEPPLSHEKESVSDEYAPETKIIVFKPPDKSGAGAPDTKVMVKNGDTQVYQVSKTAPQENAPPPKNRMVIIVGTVVVVAAIAAIIFVVVQMVR